MLEDNEWSIFVKLVLVDSLELESTVCGVNREQYSQPLHLERSKLLLVVCACRV